MQKEKNMKDCKRCFFSKSHKAWRIICLRTGRQATKPCKFFREKEDLKGYKTACEKVDTML